MIQTNYKHFYSFSGPYIHSRPRISRWTARWRQAAAAAAALDAALRRLEEGERERHALRVVCYDSDRQAPSHCALLRLRFSLRLIATGPVLSTRLRRGRARARECLFFVYVCECECGVWRARAEGDDGGGAARRP